MRYLWVEDFNDGSETEDELKKRLVNCFELDNDLVVIKSDLTSAIEFLENKNNFHVFDAIMIDIRFPAGNDSNLYEKYFSDFVTRNFYDNNINDASGIMLYLLLVFRYNISQKKIAFVSANIGNDNDKIKHLNDMIKIIVKSKYKQLTAEETREYATTEGKVGKEYLGIASSNDRKWPRFVYKKDTEYIVDKDIDICQLITQLKKLPEIYKEKFENNNREGKFDIETGSKMSKKKYYFVKEQFEKVGFVMPAAFEKPKWGEKFDKNYLFFEWENRVYGNMYNAVRSNVLEMCIVLRDCLNNRNECKIYSSFLKILRSERNINSIYDHVFFREYISDLMRLFDLREINDIEYNCNIMLKEITCLWEAAVAPEIDDSFSYDRSGKRGKKGSHKIDVFRHKDPRFYAYHATMKIVRNWIGHQGIKGVNILDVGFIFSICMRGIFDIDLLPQDKKDRYLSYEKKLFALFSTPKDEIDIRIADSLEYFIRLNDATMQINGNSRMIFDRISGLGHERSSIRREVSMDEIYMLFYHLISSENRDKSVVEIKEKIENRTWANWKERYNCRFGEWVRA